MTEPTKREIAKWCKALRSGKYSQTKFSLQNDKGFCCLGVACDVFISDKYKLKTGGGYLSGCLPTKSEQPHAPEWLRYVNGSFGDKTGLKLYHLNDTGVRFDNALERLTFDEIADCLEAVYIRGVLK